MSIVGTVWDLHGTFVLVLDDSNKYDVTCLTLHDDDEALDVGGLEDWAWEWFRGDGSWKHIGKRVS